MDAANLLSGCRVVPVVVIEDASKAVTLAETLLVVGIGAIEITLRTDAAQDAIAAVAAEVPDILVGAGSIRTPAQLARVRDLGARFAVCPGATPALLEEAGALGLPFVPGAATASEVLVLLEAGYRLQKFFPAEQLGGMAMIRALSAPIPEVRFFPTGGITPALAREYLGLPSVSCVGGSWFVPVDALRDGDFDLIRRLAGEAAVI